MQSTNGRTKAEQEIRQGKLKFIVSGRPRDDHNVYRRILKERFNADLRMPETKPKTSRDWDVITEYNKRMREEISEKYGPQALDQASADALAEWAEWKAKNPGKW